MEPPLGIAQFRRAATCSSGTRPLQDPADAADRLDLHVSVGRINASVWSASRGCAVFCAHSEEESRNKAKISTILIDSLPGNVVPVVVVLARRMRIRVRTRMATKRPISMIVRRDHSINTAS